MQKEAKFKTCGRCGNNFSCSAGDIEHCDCSRVAISEATRSFLNETNYKCICVSCLTDVQTMVTEYPLRRSPADQQLAENVHYYNANGKIVYTELYHYLTGKCCGNACRHCAYGNASDYPAGVYWPVNLKNCNQNVA